MPRDQGPRIGSNETTISILKKTVTGYKTNAAWKRDFTDIATTYTDQTMTTTGTTTIETTSTNHDIHGMIYNPPIKAHNPRVIIEDRRKIDVVTPLTPNLDGLFNTPSLAKSCPMHGPTPRQQESQLTTHIILLKASKAKEATRRP